MSSRVWVSNLPLDCSTTKRLFLPSGTLVIGTGIVIFWESVAFALESCSCWYTNWLCSAVPLSSEFKTQGVSSIKVPSVVCILSSSCSESLLLLISNCSTSCKSFCSSTWLSGIFSVGALSWFSMQSWEKNFTEKSCEQVHSLSTWCSDISSDGGIVTLEFSCKNFPPLNLVLSMSSNKFFFLWIGLSSWRSEQQWGVTVSCSGIHRPEQPSSISKFAEGSAVFIICLFASHFLLLSVLLNFVICFSLGKASFSLLLLNLFCPLVSLHDTDCKDKEMNVLETRENF